MNVDLRPSTCRMIEESPATAEAWAFIQWLQAERYTDYTIDCHIRRLMFVMPRLSASSSPPLLRRAEVVAAFGRERHPRARFFNFAGTRRVYTRFLCAQGRLVSEPPEPNADLLHRYDAYLTEVRGLSRLGASPSQAHVNHAFCKPSERAPPVAAPLTRGRRALHP